MKWEEFRAIADYQDRLVPGADRSMPGEYAPEGKVRPRDANARPMKSLPPTPLEDAENRRLQAEYIKQRSRLYGRSSPDQPQYVGLPNSQSGSLAYLGVMQDYPDRAVQRDPGVRRYDDTSATPAQQALMVRLLGRPNQVPTPQRPYNDVEAYPPPGYPRTPPEEYFGTPTNPTQGNRSRMKEVDPWVDDPGYRPWESAPPSYSLSALERPAWAEQFKAMTRVDPYEIGIGDPATAQAYLQAQRGRR
jgi:hypothetical protein